MKKIVFFDVKPYDKKWFDKLNSKRFEFEYYESKLSLSTVKLAEGADAVCTFVNDDLNEDVFKKIKKFGVNLVALRCAGYNNVNFKAAYDNKVTVVRVPAYSPHAVAEHTAALLLTLDRKIHKAYLRTRDFNFSLNGLCGFDLFGKTAGIIGTGKIGKCFIDICKGFGMNVIAYDAFPDLNSGINYVSLNELFEKSDIISLHCPLLDDTKHIINRQALLKMKDGVVLLNTSRGALIDSEALLDAIDSGKVGAAGLDVYEEEAAYFFEDKSEKPVTDAVLSLLVSKPNVIITSHQAFLTEEALKAIAEVTLNNLETYFSGGISNEICYRCEKKSKEDCLQKQGRRCFD